MSIKLVLIFTISLFFYFYLEAHTDKQFIDLRTFVKARTHQYPLPFGKKIYLCTVPRTGSTLVYNVLRFLFENLEQNAWGEMSSNLVIKTHVTMRTENDVNYVVTMRNPIDASISYYRIYYSSQQRVFESEILMSIIDAQINCLNFINDLKEKNDNVLFLRYEDFTKNLDNLFSSIEQHFSISIDQQDKEFLKNALSKENAQKNAEQFSAFTEYDDFSHYHGMHFDQGELSKKTTQFLKKKFTQKLCKFSKLYQEWGYSISPLMNKPLCQEYSDHSTGKYRVSGFNKEFFILE